ncbi:hypothetical protein V6N13_093395 [Hibiscus sabdariffa]
MHPCSDNDSVFRLFDSSSDAVRPQPEQEFSFGGDHLWDRFSVSSFISMRKSYCLIAAAAATAAAHTIRQSNRRQFSHLFTAEE